VPETTPEKVATSVPKTTPEGGSTSEPNSTAEAETDTMTTYVIELYDDANLI
jgi:hypothetical protein